MPDKNGSYSFVLRFDNKEVFKEKVRVEVGFDFNVVPRFALLGRSTEFEAITAQNISSAVWEFGDGTSPAQLTGKKATHAYKTEGEFDLRVTLRSSSGASSAKKFKIIVGDAKSSANLTLKDYEQRISRVKTDISKLPEWIQESIKTALDLSLVESTVTAARKNYNQKVDDSSTTDGEYVAIVNSLLGIEVPKEVFVSNKGILPGDVGFANIDIKHLEMISGQSAEAENAVILGIVNWMTKNYEITEDFQTISARWDFEITQIGQVYKIVISKKDTTQSDYAYFVIDYPLTDIRFKTSLDAQGTDSGGTYIGFDGASAPSLLEFVIIGNRAPDPINLGAYISPQLEKLDVETRQIRSRWWEDEEGNFNWNRFLLGISLILIFTFAAYIILQTWYKKYYEKKLFKNADDLYNLVNFIYNSRKTGTKDQVSREKLKEKKWSGEQISYAFKKIDGKRTGMCLSSLKTRG